MAARSLEEPVRHTNLDYGPFEPNFRTLSAATETFVDEKDDEWPVETASEKVTGLKFHIMKASRHPSSWFVVGVESLVLRAPVLLVIFRHTDKDVCANAPVYFGDMAAMRLLVDMIVANPERRDEIGILLAGLHARKASQ
jgi:hypothetical protein